MIYKNTFIFKSRFLTILPHGSNNDGYFKPGVKIYRVILDCQLSIIPNIICIFDVEFIVFVPLMFKNP